MTKANQSSAKADAAFCRHMGQRLANRRRELKKTATDLDKAISAPPGSVSRFENGRQNITAAQLYALSRALSVPILYFFEGLPASAKGDFVEVPAAESVAEVERFLDAYFKVPDAKVRSDILGLLKAAARG